MKARLTWKDDREELPRIERSGLRALEWVFLIVGLIALDCVVWTNSTSVLYQAYEDWAFDQSLRGLTPTMGGFVADEGRWLLSGGRERSPNSQAPKALASGNTNAPENNSADSSGERTAGKRSVIGRLEIPRLQLAVMVREGADESTLSKAVGHIPGTAMPGSIGNVGLAGHRDTFFRSLRNIRAADTINLETTNGTFRYVVKSTKIVTPRDVSVLEASGGETLTLVTCYPFYYVGSAPKRFIVHASQIGSTAQPQTLPGS